MRHNWCNFPVCRNSSALPSVGEISEINSTGGAASKKVDRKNSVLLPNGSAAMMEGSGGTGKTTGSSLAAAGSNVIGGIDNYKRY